MRLRPIIGWAVFSIIVATVIQIFPSSPRATFYFFKGRQRMAAKDYEGAVAAFQQSVEANPSFARTFIDLGFSYCELQKYSQAEQAFKQAMAIQPDSCAACGLGKVYRVQNRRADAEKYLRTSMQLNPQDSCALNQLGRMYYDAKEYPKAIEAFEQEVKLNPNAVSFHFLANAFHHSGKIKESIQYYIEATHANPNYENVLVDLGSAYHELGRTTEAFDVFERAVKLQPDDQKARAFLGVMQFEMGNREGAMQQYRWLLKKNPELAAELLRGYEDLSEDAKKVELLKSPPK